MKRSMRLLAGLTILAVVPSCARLIHPERVGNKSGAIDTIPLVVDIVLFIPGLVPGLIAIIVDFGTGAIYLNGGSPTQLGDAGTLQLVPIGDEGREAFVQLIDDKGVVLAETRIDIAAVKSGQRIELQPTMAVDPNADQLAALPSGGSL